MTLPHVLISVLVLTCASCAAPNAASIEAPLTQGSGAPSSSRASYEAPPKYVNRSTVLVGQRRLDADTWDPLENQLLAGMEISRVNAYTGNGYEFGLNGSFDDEELGNSEFDLLVIEAFVGFRVQKPQGKFRPFVGLGGAFSFVDAAVKGDLAADSENGFALGGYLHGGINFEIARDLDLVLEVRQRVGQDVDLNGVDLDIDYLTFAVGVAF